MSEEKMPTEEQITTVRMQIEDVISRRYIESNGNLCSCWFQPETSGPIGMTIVNGPPPPGNPEAFNEIPGKAQIEILDTLIDWKGFDDSQEVSIIQRVLDGKSPDLWMEGMQPDIECEQEPERGFEIGD
jgi:hypothetical protein